MLFNQILAFIFHCGSRRKCGKAQNFCEQSLVDKICVLHTLMDCCFYNYFDKFFLLSFASLMLRVTAHWCKTSLKICFNVVRILQLFKCETFIQTYHGCDKCYFSLASQRHVQILDNFCVGPFTLIKNNFTQVFICIYQMFFVSESFCGSYCPM